MSILMFEVCAYFWVTLTSWGSLEEQKDVAIYVSSVEIIFQFVEITWSELVWRTR